MNSCYKQQVDAVYCNLIVDDSCSDFVVLIQSSVLLRKQCTHVVTSVYSCTHLKELNKVSVHAAGESERLLEMMKNSEKAKKECGLVKM